MEKRTKLYLFFLQKTSHNILSFDLYSKCILIQECLSSKQDKDTKRIMFYGVQKYFDDRFAAFQMLWNKIGPLVSRDFQSHDCFDAHGGIYSANTFPSPIISISRFRTSQKPLQVSIKTFFVN